MKKQRIMLLVIALLVATDYGCKRKALDELVAEGKYEEADSYCESIKKEQKSQCYSILATLYFRKDKFDKAAFFYAKAGEHIKVIHSYFQGNLLDEAENYTRSQQGQVKRTCAALVAKKYYLYGEKEKAITFYRMAGQNQMANYIEKMLPVFDLYSRSKESLAKIEDPALRKKITAFNTTLKSYIYMDDFLQWPYGRSSAILEKANDVCLKALLVIEETAAPTFIEKMKQALATGSWNQKQVTDLAVSHMTLDSLLKMVGYIHKIAKLKPFFTSYSVVYDEQAGQRNIGIEETQSSPSHKSVNYEQAFAKALEHGEGIFDTIEFLSRHSRQSGLETYLEDFTIDLGVMDYIKSFMENLQTRIKDIQQRTKQYQDTKGGELEKKKADRLFQDFVAAGNHSLYDIWREEYQNANDRLTSAYESAKRDLKIQ